MPFLHKSSRPEKGNSGQGKELWYGQFGQGTPIPTDKAQGCKGPSGGKEGKVEGTLTSLCWVMWPMLYGFVHLKEKMQ